MSPVVVFVLKGYPRLSETFIAQEIRELERQGIVIRIVSLRRPTDEQRHPIHDEIQAAVSYLPEYLHREPRRVLSAWWRLRRSHRYPDLWRKFCADFRRAPTRNIIRRLGQALVLACETNEGDVHFHAHFLHTPATVTHYAAIVTGKPWSVSAHAKDIWTSAHWDLKEKLASCEWAVTCTKHNCQHLQSLSGDPDRVELVYHGLDLDRFNDAPVRQRAHSPKDGVTMLSVGRLVEKKGYEDLLLALSLLPADLAWKFVHIGGGERAESLLRQASQLGIADRISWRGAQSQAAVLEAYRSADLFVLASRIAADGDRDGLPNVLMEAQSQALACVSTRVSAIPELITDGENGLLVDAGNARQMAGALERLICDAALRTRLGRCARERIAASFSLSSTIVTLVEKFQSINKAVN